MEFSSYEFWLSLLPSIIIILIGNYCLRNNDTKRLVFHKIFICGLSLSLLGMTNLLTLCIFLFVILTAWIACNWAVCRSKKTKHILLAFLIIVLLLPLGYYKYADFIFNDIAGRQWDALRDLIIPIGISFYTFQILGFCIDTLKNDEPIPQFIDYINFSSFFPQIVAGPIERKNDLLPQMQHLDLRLKFTNLNQGIPYIILGLFFKLTLADNMAAAFIPDYMGNSALTIWTNNLLFTFRIYFDFAGYGLTAYGIAKCLGITLRMNFLSPYTATNISDFWRRWHTSLTLWFRDYIYFPLGGSRTKRWALNLLIVFAISGIWHGAGWNFILWGIISGISIVIHRIFRNVGKRLPSMIGWIITFGLMVCVWMFFYDTNLEHLSHHISVICHIENYSISSYLDTVISLHQRGSIPFLLLPLAFLTIGMEYLSSLKNKNNPYHFLLTPSACCVMVFLMITLGSFIQNSFIYFSF